MATTGAMHTFEVALSDVDRSVYESLSLRVARHVSETPEYLVARVLAYTLEFTEGIQFTAGLAAAEEPAIEVRDLTGVRNTWIEVGTPDGERLHRASKSVDRVAVYCHKDVTPWLRLLGQVRLHRPDRIFLYELDRKLVAELAARLDRRTAWSVSRSDGELYLEVAGSTFSAALSRLELSSG